MSHSHISKHPVREDGNVHDTGIRYSSIPTDSVSASPRLSSTEHARKVHTVNTIREDVESFLCSYSSSKSRPSSQSTDPLPDRRTRMSTMWENGKPFEKPWNHLFQESSSNPEAHRLKFAFELPYSYLELGYPPRCTVESIKQTPSTESPSLDNIPPVLSDSSSVDSDSDFGESDSEDDGVGNTVNIWNHIWTCVGSGSTTQSTGGHISSSTSQGTQNSNNTNGKRAVGGDEKDDGRKKRPRKGGKTPCSGGSPEGTLYPCPFFKQNPTLFKGCKDIRLPFSRIKEHINRNHYRDILCRICGAGWGDEGQLERHQRNKNGCKRISTPELQEKKSRHQRQSAAMKKSAGRTKDWDNFCRILFPSLKTPPSPTLPSIDLSPEESVDVPMLAANPPRDSSSFAVQIATMLAASPEAMRVLRAGTLRAQQGYCDRGVSPGLPPQSPTPVPALPQPQSEEPAQSTQKGSLGIETTDSPLPNTNDILDNLLPMPNNLGSYSPAPSTTVHTTAMAEVPLDADLPLLTDYLPFSDMINQSLGECEEYLNDLYGPCPEPPQD